MLTDRLRQVVTDSVANSLGLVNQTSVERSTLITSNSVTVTGLAGPVGITITSGEYSINGAAFTSTAGTIANGNTLRVRHTSAAGYLGITTTTIQIGVGVSDWSTSTRGQDIQPASFGFTAITNAALSTVQTSNSITVSAMDSDTVATVTVGGGNYSKNGAGYANTPTTAVNGDIFSLQHVSSGSYSTAVQTTLTVNNQQAIFTSTSRAQDTVPNNFSFTALTGAEPSTTYLSNAITVSGLDVGATATVTVSGGSYSKNVQPLTTAAGTAQNGDIFQVTKLSAAVSAPLTTVWTTLTIGGVLANFNVTTRANDMTPAAFTFTDVTESALTTTYISNTITVTGMDPGYTVAVAYQGFGSYSKNGGTYTSSAGTAVLGDTFSVRVVSYSGGGVTQTGTLTIGGVSDGFSVTTRVGDTTPDPYTFTDLATQACNTEILSNVYIVAGVEATYSATLSLSGTGTSWRKNGGSWNPAGIGGSVQTNDTVQLRVVTDNVLNKAWAASINIGGVPDMWTVVTGNDGEPDVYVFHDYTGVVRSAEYVSNIITITGLTPGYRAPVACAGDVPFNPRFRINGSTVVSMGTLGSIANGETLEAMLLSSANPLTAAAIQVAVGGGTIYDIWYITTA
jgi:hypothetical protein